MSLKVEEKTSKKKGTKKYKYRFVVGFEEASRGRSAGSTKRKK